MSGPAVDFARMLRGAVAIFGLLFAADSPRAQIEVQNPTGSCGIRHDGGRAGYHHPGPNLWVPDCQSKLRREYWRVFLRPSGDASTIPRPDGAPELHAVCADPQHELRPIVDRYVLCSRAASAEVVRTVNSMKLDDALRIARFLHDRLRFVTSAAPVWGITIVPYPVPSDVVEACELEPKPNSAALRERCKRARVRQEDFVLDSRDADAVEELATRLNRLYGVQ